MIKEFAIEPEVMANWENFRLLFPDFGVGKGRMIARYPKDWAKVVDALVGQLEAKSQLGSIKAASIRGQIFDQKHKHKFVPARREFDKNEEWLRNAESAPRFDAIIANENPRKSPAVLGIQELDREDPRYKTSGQKKVPRTAKELAGCAKVLLGVCEEIQIVDTYFAPEKPESRETLLEMLDMRANAPQQLKKIEIHTRKPNSFMPAVQEANYQHFLQQHIPKGTTLRVFFWSRKSSGERLHPRFLLTEFGGLQYDYGLDEGDGGKDCTIVTLLDHDLWQTLRNDYSEAGTTFEIDQNSIIQISRKQE